jgi:predicted small lipoprotein YifL
MKRLLLCLTAVMPLALTVACGQKGPLYLPPRNGTVVTRPAGSVPAPSTNTPSGTPQTTNQPPSQGTTTPSTQSSSPGAPGNKSDKDNSQTPPKSP